MYVKLFLENLNSDSYPPYIPQASAYTYGVTITPRVCGGDYSQPWTQETFKNEYACTWP